MNFSFVFYVNAAQRIYYENFDDHILDQPSVGDIQVVRSISPITVLTKGVDYVLNAPGRNGSSGSFQSLQKPGYPNASAWMWYRYNNTWPSSNQMYVSLWVRYPHFVRTTTHENIKLFYPHWDGTSSYVAYDLATEDSMYHSEKSNGNYVSNGNWIIVPNQTDGNWHHYEFFLDFEKGISRFWYDGNIAWDKNWGTGTWSVPVQMYYLTFGMIDAQVAGNFTRQYDDIEVWDGMPTSVSAPTNLRILANN